MPHEIVDDFAAWLFTGASGLDAEHSVRTTAVFVEGLSPTEFNATHLLSHYHSLSIVYKVYLHDQINMTTELGRKMGQINTARLRCLILRPATHVRNRHTNAPS